MKKKYVLFAAILTSCRLFAPEKSDAVAKTTDGVCVSPAVTKKSAKVSPPLRPKKKEYIPEYLDDVDIPEYVPGDVDVSESDDDEMIIKRNGLLKCTRREQKKRLKKFTHDAPFPTHGRVVKFEALDIRIYGKDALFLVDDIRVSEDSRRVLEERIKRVGLTIADDGTVYSKE